MNAHIPERVAAADLHHFLISQGLVRMHQGKVRDTYSLPGHPELLVVASDRISIFDFVLPCRVERKGEVLTALTVFWLTSPLGEVDHHLVTYGAGIDRYLPPALREKSGLRKRALVVRRLQMIPVECIVRGYLTGSGFAAYQEAGAVCGHRLPEDLNDGSYLPTPIFTPTTKAEAGHDQHLDFQSVTEEYGPELGELALRIYGAMRQYALERGIVLADTKMEFGYDQALKIVLADEVGTPDSSRFWDLREWEQAVARGHSPAGFDKQGARNWGKTVETPWRESEDKPLTGIHRLNPECQAHLDFVHSLQIPLEVTLGASRRYRQIFRRLTGSELEAFQKEVMGIS